MCFKKNLLGPWNIRSPWREAILLNWGVTALRVPVPYGDPCVTSSVQPISVTREPWKTNPELTGRILVYNRLKVGAIHPREIAIVNVLLELRISPGVDDQDELFCGRRPTHVTLTLVILNTVPSSSQFPGVVRINHNGEQRK
jgi:hypothetical protein